MTTDNANEIRATDDTRKRLIAAAGHVFAQHGYAAATVREICELATANVAAVSFHFGGKYRLYVETVKSSHSDVAAGTVPEPVSGAPAVEPVEQLKQFIRGMIRHLFDESRPTWHMQLMLREMTHPTEAVEEVVEQFIRPMWDHLNDILAQLMPDDTDPVRRHHVAFSIVSQCLHHRVHRVVGERLVGSAEYSTYTPEVFADHIIAFSLAALGCGPGLGRPVSVSSSEKGSP